MAPSMVEIFWKRKGYGILLFTLRALEWDKWKYHHAMNSNLCEHQSHCNTMHTIYIQFIVPFMSTANANINSLPQIVS